MPRAGRCPACFPPLKRNIHTSRPSTNARLSKPLRSAFFTPRAPTSRPFSHRSSLLFVARSSSRPQLPFLHPSSHGPNPTSLYRHLTTERKARWKATFRWHLRFHAYAWPILFLCYIAYVGSQQVTYEHRYSTPREWSMMTRWYLRSARHVELDDDAKVRGLMTDWQLAGYFYAEVMRRLESEKYEGTNLIQGETLVAGVGRTGLDIGMKSEPWRRGYYQAIMGAGRAAEHLDRLAKRKGEDNGRLIPWESVPGPNNPRPKPLPWHKSGIHLHPPTEEECEDAFPQPEVFYMKVLTTKGFDNTQRLDAALAYADWCDYKGLSETAGSMYDWALDIAAGGLPVGLGGVVDIQTGVIQKGKEELVSRNLMKATTSLAVHHARRGEVKEALPIFLSILRARKTLPAAPSYFEPEQKKRPTPTSTDELIAALRDLVFDAPFPPPPPSGDERPYHTLAEACEEIGLMTYIGEILFATSTSEKEKGLGWTRDSVDAAEAVMWVMDETKEDDGKEKCRQCLETGLDNWQAMAKEMERLSEIEEQKAQQYAGFWGTGWGKDSVVEKAKREVERWKQEEDQIQLRVEKTLPLVKPLKPLKAGWFTV